MGQIQPREHVLDHADYSGPTRQDELDLTRSGTDLLLEDLDHELWESIICR